MAESKLPVPSAVAFLACLDLTEDPQTKQISLHRLVKGVVAKRFPVTVAKLFFFLELRGGRGVTPLTLRLVDADAARPPIVNHESDFDMQNPLTTTELFMSAERIVFPEAGEYCLQLLVSDTLVAERRLAVMQG